MEERAKRKTVLLFYLIFNRNEFMITRMLRMLFKEFMNDTRPPRDQEREERKCMQIKMGTII